MTLKGGRHICGHLRHILLIKNKKMIITILIKGIQIRSQLPVKINYKAKIIIVIQIMVILIIRIVII